MHELVSKIIDCNGTRTHNHLLVNMYGQILEFKHLLHFQNIWDKYPQTKFAARFLDKLANWNVDQTVF